jgi:uncharacterized short protein YbdD (DUF466 family)
MVAVVTEKQRKQFGWTENENAERKTQRKRAKKKHSAKAWGKAVMGMFTGNEEIMDAALKGDKDKMLAASSNVSDAEFGVDVAVFMAGVLGAKAGSRAGARSGRPTRTKVVPADLYKEAKRQGKPMDPNDAEVRYKVEATVNEWNNMAVEKQVNTLDTLEWTGKYSDKYAAETGETKMPSKEVQEQFRRYDEFKSKNSIVDMNFERFGEYERWDANRGRDVPRLSPKEWNRLSTDYNSGDMGNISFNDYVTYNQYATGRLRLGKQPLEFTEFMKHKPGYDAYLKDMASDHPDSRTFTFEEYVTETDPNEQVEVDLFGDDEVEVDLWGDGDERPAAEEAGETTGLLEDPLDEYGLTAAERAEFDELFGIQPGEFEFTEAEMAYLRDLRPPVEEGGSATGTSGTSSGAKAAGAAAAVAAATAAGVEGAKDKDKGSTDSTGFTDAGDTDLGNEYKPANYFDAMAYLDPSHRQSEMPGWSYEASLSSEKIAVFKKDNTYHIAFRGTVPSDVDDLKSDMTILSGTRSDARFEESLKAVQGIAAFTGGNIELSGHSLGGSIATHVLYKCDPALYARITSVTTFNRGASPAEWWQGVDTSRGSKATNIFQKGDAISAAGISVNDGSKKIVYSNNHNTPLGAHGLNSFQHSGDRAGDQMSRIEAKETAKAEMLAYLTNGNPNWESLVTQLALQEARESGSNEEAAVANVMGQILNLQSLADTVTYVGGEAWEAFLLAETGAEVGAVVGATAASGGGVAAVAFAGVAAETAMNEWQSWYAGTGGDPVADVDYTLSEEMASDPQWHSAHSTLVELKSLEEHPDREGNPEVIKQLRSYLKKHHAMFGKRFEDDYQAVFGEPYVATDSAAVTRCSIGTDGRKLCTTDPPPSSEDERTYPQPPADGGDGDVTMSDSFAHDTDCPFCSHETVQSRPVFQSNNRPQTSRPLEPLQPLGYFLYSGTLSLHGQRVVF